MKKTRRSYDKAFKEMAVELVLSGRQVKEVASDLDISRDVLNRWKREYQQLQEGRFPGHGKPALSPEQAEITRLKKELREAQLERDILKKAVRIFSKSDGKSMSS